MKAKQNPSVEPVVFSWTLQWSLQPSHSLRGGDRRWRTRSRKPAVQDAAAAAGTVSPMEKNRERWWVTKEKIRVVEEEMSNFADSWFWHQDVASWLKQASPKASACWFTQSSLNLCYTVQVQDFLTNCFSLSTWINPSFWTETPDLYENPESKLCISSSCISNLSIVRPHCPDCPHQSSPCSPPGLSSGSEAGTGLWGSAGCPCPTSERCGNTWWPHRTSCPSAAVGRTHASLGRGKLRNM